MRLFFRSGINYNFLKYLFCISLITSFSFQLSAQSIDTLFSSDEILKMELRTDFASIQRGRSDSSEYFSGKLIYGTGSNTVKLNVKVKARGNFRRNPKNCNFPPLLLNFKKNEVGNTLFRNQDKIKLVTPCQNEEDVIQEYLIYKLYNLVTDLSLNVRLVKIEYFDTGSEKMLFTRYSFFIEDIDNVADRANSRQVKMFMTPFNFDRDNYIKMTLFQYMVGNIDWYVTTGHNIAIMQPADSSDLPSAVPYDFDFSQFVDAHYSKPKGVLDEDLKTRRVFRGICFTDAEFEMAFDFYNALKPSFTELIKKKKFISQYTRTVCLEHIEYFFNVINNKELVKSEILDICETKKLYNLPEK